MLTKGAIGNLINRYRAVLTKCNLINTFGSLAVASMLVLGGVGVAEATTGWVDKPETVDHLAYDANGAGGGNLTVSTAEDYTIYVDGTPSTSGAVTTHGIIAGAGAELTNAGQIWVYAPSGSYAAGMGTAYGTNGKSINEGTIYVDGASAYQVKGMNADSGGTVINDGTIVVKGGAGMTDGSGDIAKTITNKGSIEVVGSGYGIFYSKNANSTVTNSGSINVIGEDGVGVVVTGAENKSFINNGTITADEKSTALAISGTAKATVTNAGTITGKIIIDGVKNCTQQVIENAGTLTVTNGNISNNEKNHTSLVQGVINNTGTATFTNTTFKNNTFSGGKEGNRYGALYNAGGDMTITGGLFEGNVSGNMGGAIYNSSTLNISGTEFKSNSAGDGGVLYQNAKTATISGAIFTSNTASRSGGVIAVEGQNQEDPNVIFQGNNTFTSNSAAQNGGALYLFAAGSPKVRFDKSSVSSFSSNSAAQGGAIHNASELTIDGVTTYSNNTANNLGGAIYNAGILSLSGTNIFSGNKLADGTLNDIHNEGTLTITGDITLDGGITSGEKGTVDMSGANITVTNADTKVAGDVTTNDKTTITATGAVNDALGGNASTLLTNLQADAGTTITLQEGLMQGETKATVTETADGDTDVKVTSSKPSSTVTTAVDLSALMPLALNRILMNDIRKRMGDLRTNPSEYGAWARYEGGKLKGDGGTTNNFSTIQVGADKAIGDSFRLGAAFSYTYGDIDQANGGSESDTFIFSGYGIWMGQNGMFADLIARIGNSDTDMNVMGLKASTDAMTYSLSGEFGWRFDLPQNFYVEPQAELTYTYVDGDEYSLSYAKFDVDETHSFIGRLGLLAGWKFCDRGDVYVRASVLQEFDGDAKVTASMANVAPETYETNGEDTWLEYGIGANVKLTDNTYVWADVERTEGADIEEEWRGTVGVRFSF